MGAALVIPTKDVKILIPSTAASLHRAFRKPKAVVLLGAEPQGHRAQRKEDGRQSGVKRKQCAGAGRMDGSDRRGWGIQTHWETRERRWKQRLVIRR